jgi:hypothetical protein
LRRVLRSAERLSDRAIDFAPLSLKTPGSRSSALLCEVTLADQRGPAGFGPDLGDFAAGLRPGTGPVVRRPARLRCADHTSSTSRRL